MEIGRGGRGRGWTNMDMRMRGLQGGHFPDVICDHPR